MARTAVVVGGGLAGCAAALRLARSGWRVTLLERHPRLGGKVGAFAFSWAGAPSGWVDNGQHVLTKGCTRLRAFLEDIGAGPKVRWQPRLRIPFASPGGRITLLTRWDLPSPLHLLPGALSFDLLSVGERLGLRRALSAARDAKAGPALDAMDFAAWLRARGQGDAALSRFWDPLAYAICNAPCAAVGARTGLWMVREAFCRAPDALDLGIPAVPQHELFAPEVAARLLAFGGAVRTGAVVEAILQDGGRATGVRFRGGEELFSDAVVLAVPWEAASALLPGRLSAADALRPGAILSVALKTDRPVLPEGEDMVALVDSPVQWAFAKPGNVLNLVLSGANALVDRPGAALIAMAEAALRERLPRMAGAIVLDAVAMREKRATFLPGPGSEALRPRADAAGLPGLALAGAWTATGWPATMEGAVRSGEAAADTLGA